mmetsp:Transcript_103107/g.204770  ORF Transcript_103107/g.204770 Transcript_103107/m.204770 type:complete len:490 (+) Transcript_103107:71-1540(+)
MDVAANSAPPLASGTPVDYYSQSAGNWIPGIIQRFDAQAGTYQLDVHAAAPPSRVRPRRQFQDGSSVEYYSATSGAWVPAIVHGFDGEMGTYKLDIQPMALASKVRAPVEQGDAWVAKVQKLVDERVPAGHPVPGCSLEQTIMFSDQDIWGFAWKFVQQQHAVAGFDSDPLQDERVWKASKYAWKSWRGVRDALIRDCGAGGDGSAGGADRLKAGAEVIPPAGPAPCGPGQKPCSICMAPRQQADLLGPECGHLFCSRCLRSHVMRFDFCKSTVGCPCCGFEMPASLKKCAVGSEAWAEKQEQMEREDAALAESLARGAKLPCPKCGRDEHEGISCEQFKEWEKENANAERHFADLLAQERWRRCPVCGVASERACGCNFMQCRSATCNKRTYWCYICGWQLSREDHYSHYPRSPWEDVCHTPLDKHIPFGAGPPQGAPQAAQAQRPQVAAAQAHRHAPVPAGMDPRWAAARPKGVGPGQHEQENCCIQ